MVKVNMSTDYDRLLRLKATEVNVGPIFTSPTPSKHSDAEMPFLLLTDKSGGNRLCFSNVLSRVLATADVILNSADVRHQASRNKH